MSGTSVDGIDVACVDLDLDGDELSCGYRGLVSVPFRIAARGTVSPALLRRLAAEPYYRLPPPRSTGRELFNAAYLEAMLPQPSARPAPDDVSATVTRLLVDLLVAAVGQHGLTELILSGGGAGNATTLRWLRESGPEVRVLTTADLGLPVQAKEAVAFAVLGFLTWNGLPGSVTAATGARHPSILGTIQPGSAPLVMPEPAAVAPRRMRFWQRAVV